MFNNLSDIENKNYIYHHKHQWYTVYTVKKSRRYCDTKSLEIKLLICCVNNFVFLYKAMLARFLHNLRAEHFSNETVRTCQNTRVQETIWQRKNKKINDMLSILHAKDAFWISLFFKIFPRSTIVSSRRSRGDKM